MGKFPHSITYRGYTIRRTSFNWRVVELNEIVESIEEGKILIDKEVGNA